MRDLHQVGVAGVGAGADAYLIHLHALQLADGLDRIGRMRTGGQRLQSTEVDDDMLVILRVVVRAQRDIYVLASLSLQEFEGVLIGGEDRGCSAQLRAHVGDGSSLGHAQALYALSGVLDDLADSALDGHTAQYFEDDILCADILAELAGQLDLDHAGHGDIVFAAAHSYRYVQAARAYSQHAYAAAGGGVGVGADQSLARSGEALQMHLVTDAVARA